MDDSIEAAAVEPPEKAGRVGAPPFDHRIGRTSGLAGAGQTLSAGNSEVQAGQREAASGTAVKQYGQSLVVTAAGFCVLM